MEKRTFILKLAAVCSLIVLLHVAMIPFVDGTILIYFHKCSSPKQHSLIIGASRASQALMPSVFKDSLGIDILNFAFNGTTSPYSKVYSHAINEKIDNNSTKGTFILCVEPWSIGMLRDSITGELKYTEEKNILNELCFFNGYPNVEFIAKDYDKGWGNIAYTSWRKNSSITGHEDGWIEVMREIDSTDIAKRTKGKADGMRSSLPYFSFSTERLNELTQLIAQLKKHGEVYLVRLPVAKGIFEIEEELNPTFDSLITTICTSYNAHYFNMQPLHEEMVFNDGHHINRQYAPKCSSMIASWIKGIATSEKK
jgi:hypothetical protein